MRGVPDFSMPFYGGERCTRGQSSSHGRCKNDRNERDFEPLKKNMTSETETVQYTDVRELFLEGAGLVVGQRAAQNPSCRLKHVDPPQRKGLNEKVK